MLKDFGFNFRCLLIITVLTFLQININAQSAILDSSMWHSKILDIEYINDSEYVIAKQSYFHGDTKVEWIRNDSIKKSFYIDADLSSLNFRKSAQGVVMDASSFLDCDVIFPRFGSFLLDTITRERIYLPFYSEFALFFPSIFSTSDNNIVLLDGQNRFLNIKGSNQEEINFELPSTDIQNLHETQNYVLAFGGKYLYFYEKGEYNLDSIIFDTQQVLDVAEGREDSSIYVMTESAVYEITYQTKEEISKYDLKEAAGRNLDIIYAKQLYLLYTSDGLGYRIDTIDSEGNWQRFESIETQNYTISELYDMEENGIWAVGQFFIEDIGENGHLGSSIIFQLDDKEDIQNNIGIHNLSVARSDATTLEFNFEVSNQSSEELNDIKVYSSIISVGFCFYEYLEYNISSLAANMDTAISVQKSVFFLPEEFDFCLYALGSGTDPDLDLSDNINCLLFSKVQEDGLRKKNLVYPNPARNEIYIDEFQNNDELEIYSIDGRLMRRDLYQEGVNIANLNQGIYYLRKKGLERKTYKFIKL